MVCLNLIDLPQAIPLGCITGQYGAQAVLDELNATWRNNGSGVIFGEDTFGQKFKEFSSMIASQTKLIADSVLKAVEAVTCPNKIQAIESEDDLKNVPPCMFIPILTMPEVRPLFEGGQLSGWDVDPAQLPSEDVVGRLLNNGRIDTGAEDYDRDSPMSWTFKTGDPDYTVEELRKIRTTRNFISAFLEEQMGPGGDQKDITDIPNRMGKLRSLK